MLIAASILCADFRCLEAEVKRLEEAGVDWLHFDIMDGHFVENLTFGPLVMEALRPLTRLPMDAHLMVLHPERQIEKFARAGAKMIGFHLEAVGDPRPLVEEIHEAGCAAAVALNPDYPVEQVAPLLPYCDAVLLMSVFAGAAGQKYIPASTARARQLAEMVSQHAEATGRRVQLWVDGGINPQTARELCAVGVEVFVTGNFLFTHPGGYAAAVRELRAACA
jgi:ribulose-phosphate 3-epimerase